jgi:hypothetical protein
MSHDLRYIAQPPFAGDTDATELLRQAARLPRVGLRSCTEGYYPKVYPLSVDDIYLH